MTETEVRLWDARTGEPLTLPLTGDGGFQSGYGRMADAAVAGDMVLVRRNSQTSQYDRWSLTPDGRPVTELRELAEALAGRRRDAEGNLQPIAADELFALRKRLAGRFPERYGDSVASPDAVLTHRSDPRIKQLADRLADAKSSAERRVEAAYTLGYLKHPAGQAPLVVGLRDADVTVRRAAASALGNIDPSAAETVRALVQALKEDKDDQARANAARALNGSAAKTITGELILALKEDKSAGVREAAAFTLRTASADPALLAALRAACDDKQSARLQAEAAMSVAVLVPDDKDAIGVLTSALSDKDQWAGSLAARYLSDLGPRAAPAAAALAKVVEKGNFQPHFIEETWYAIHALAKIGPAAKPALPALLAKLGQDQSNPNWYNPTTKYVAVHENMIAYTLGRIGPDAVPDLLKVFKEDKDAHRRRAAVLALGYLGPPAKEAVADLEAEAKKLADKEEKTSDEQFLATALEKALGRIRDPNAIPIEKLE